MEESILCSQDGKAQIHSAESGTPMSTLHQPASGHSYPSLKWLNNNDVITCSTMGKVQIWNAFTGSELASIQVSEDPLFTIDYNPTYKIFSVAGQDQIIRVYDLETLKLTTKYHEQIDGQTNRIFAVKFDPSRPNMLYSGGWACSLLEHDIKERKKIGDIFGPYICGESIDIKDNLMVVGSYTSDSYLRIYDVKTLAKLDDLKWQNDSGRGGFIYSVKFANSNSKKINFIIAGSANANEVKIFQSDDASRFKEINQISGFQGGILSLDIDKTSRKIIVGSQEGEFSMFHGEGYFIIDSLDEDL